MSDDKTPPLLVPPPAHISGKAVWAIVGLCLVVCLLAYYMFEGWRGQKAWQSYVAAQKAKGVTLNWEAYLPPTVPEDQNFAMTPVLKPILDFVPGTQITKSERPSYHLDRELAAANELSKSMGFNLGYNFLQQNHRRWEKGETLDLIRLLGTNDAKFRLSSKTTNGPILEKSPDSQTKAATIIRDIQNQTTDGILDELSIASKKASCRFGVPYDHVPCAEILLPHLGALKNITAQVSWRAEALLALGEVDKAFDDLRLAYYLSDTVRGEPLIISPLIRIACRQMVTQIVYDGMAAHKWTDSQLQRLIEGLSKDDFMADSQQTFLGERALSLHTIEAARTGENGFRLDNLLTQENPRFKPMHFVCPAGWMFFEQLNFCQAWDRVLDLFEQWKSGQRDTHSLFQEVKKDHDLLFKDSQFSANLVEHRLLARTYVPEFSRFLKRSFQAQVTVDLTRVACALERAYLAQGDYPETLDVLVPKYIERLPNDPMSGQPLIYYKDEAKHFTLYSVGANFNDDGGSVRLDKRGNWLPEEGDWVWKM